MRKLHYKTRYNDEPLSVTERRQAKTGLARSAVRSKECSAQGASAAAAVGRYDQIANVTGRPA